MQSSMLKSIVEDFGNGGTIDGDLSISGDLTVSGGGSLSFDEIIEGTQVIDITSTEAFLVRKNGDGGDLFTLDTTNSRMLFGGEIRLNDKDGDGTFGGRIRYDNSDNELRIEANEVSGDDVVIKGNDAIKFEDSGGTKMLLDAGKLTVGSDTSPTGILHIAPGSGSAPTMFFEQHTSATDGTLGEISFGNRAVDGQLALIQAKNDGANDSAFLAFHTEVTSGALTERMRITSSGNTGIGEDTPLSTLVVRGANAVNPSNGNGGNHTLQVIDTTTIAQGVGGGIAFGGNFVGTSETLFAEIRGIKENATSHDFDSALIFSTRIEGADITERMRISSDGKVGIGKAPDTLLHLYSTSASKPILKIENEQGGGNPVSIQMLRNTSSPDDDDFIGQIDFRSMNDASTPEEINYAYINSQSTDITDGEEDGEINFFTMKAGTLTRTMTMQSGEVGVNDSDPAKILSVKATANDDGISLKNSSGQFLALIHQQDSDAGMLRLYDESSTTKIAFNADSGENSYFNNGGNVGIGVTAPDKLLTLGQDATDGAQTAYLKILDTDTDTTADTRLEILFSKYHTGTDMADVASIGGGIEQWSGTSSNRNAYLEFMTVASGSRSQALKLGSDKSALFSGQIHLGSSNQLRIYSEGSGGSDNQIILAKLNNLRILNQHHGGNINFSTESSSGTAVTNMILDSDSRISLSNNDSGTSNTIFGKNCAISLDAGSDYNVFIGENVSDASMDDATKNVGIGYNALSSLTTADSNVAIGYEAHKNNSTGGSNVVIGANAGDAMTNSSSNVVIGSFALTDADSGESNNVIIGANAGKDMDSSSNDDNVVVGKDAGMGNLDQCVVVGKSAMQSTGSNAPSNSLGTVAIGTSSCESLTTGTGTTAVGYETCKTINVGDQNTAIGYQALKSADTGEYNVAVGYQALLDNVDGSHNTAVGRLALENFEPSSANEGHNSALGSLAGNDVSTGTFNTAIGSNSGHDGTNNLTTGTQNTFLGAYTNGSGANAGNQTVIGYNADGTGDNEIALGNTSISAIKAQVTSITAYSSDERTKKDVADYDLKGVDFIKELKLKTYLYKNPVDFPDEIRHSKWDAKDEDGNLIHERPSDPTETQVGLIAQEVEAALAKHGVGNVETYAPTQDSGIKTLTYGNLIFPLIKAVQELSARVEELESK